MWGQRFGIGIGHGRGRRAAAFLGAIALAVTGLAPTAAATPVSAAATPVLAAAATPVSAAAVSAAGAPSTTDSADSLAPDASATADPDCPWVGSSAPIEQKVADVLDRMTLDEKISMVHGADRGDYTGRIAAIPRLCIPALKLQDGPVGVRMSHTTQLPAAVSLASTFDSAIAKKYGSVIGTEMKAKGADVDLGPTVNIIRDPRWGRSFESYSEDPFLTGAIGSATIDGIQDAGVMAQVKHWAVYNQETYRNTPQDNAIIDDRTVHEIYTRAFEDIVEQSNPSSVMCSYSTINGTYACENPELNTILKDQWKFPGFITSDWGGTHSAVGSANAGMDMEMPGSTWFDGRLKSAVLGGTVPQARLDDMVSRILTEEFRFDLIDHPSPDTPDAVASTDEHVEFARDVAEAGTVLLRNQDGALPLDTASESDTNTVKSIAVIGDSAGRHTLSGGGGSAAVAGTGTVSPYDGIKARAGKDISVQYAQGTPAADGSQPAIGTEFLQPVAGDEHGLTAEYFDNKNLEGDPVVTRVDPQVDAVYSGSPAPGVPATNFSVRWTGTLTAPTTGSYTVSLTSDDGSRLKINGSTVIDYWSDHASHTKSATVELTAGEAVDVELDYYNAGGGGTMILGWLPPGTDLAGQATDLAKNSDVAIVYSSVRTSEGGDLADIELPAADNELIEKVAAVNRRTIVVLNTGSAVTMPWIDDVAGVLEAWYPGQQSGNAIAALLFGDVNPSGKLPVTFPVALDQVPAASPERFPGVDGTVQYSEQRQIGYRWYDAQEIAPLFPFGFGLSYTSFRLSNLKLAGHKLTEDGTIKAKVTVANTGERSGAQVVQAYLSSPDPSGQEPPRRLVGVAKVELKPGQSKRVSLTIRGQDAMNWNTEAQQWQLPKGAYTVSVGSSSRDLPLQAGFTVSRTQGPLYTTVQAPERVTPGEQITVTTSFTNLSSSIALRAATRLTLPEGWTAQPKTPADRPTVLPGRTVSTRWLVTVPDDATGGAHELSAVTSSIGNRTPARSASIDVPFRSLADSFDTVGITADADPGPGNLDGKGYSYSAEGLASVGIVPGGAVEGGFSWPTAPSGTPNSATAVGQSIALSGSGTSLGVLGAATNGTATGTVSVHYTDGTSSSGTITLADWYSAKAVAGCTLVAISPTWNRPAVTTYPKEHKVGVYATEVALTPGKQVASVTLPNSETMHVFALAVRG